MLGCYSLIVQNVFLHLPMMGGEIHEIVQIMFNGLFMHSQILDLATKQISSALNSWYSEQLYLLTNFVVRYATRSKSEDYNTRKCFFLYQYREKLWHNLQDNIFISVWSILSSPAYLESQKREIFSYCLQFSARTMNAKFEGVPLEDDIIDDEDDVDILSYIFSPLEDLDIGEKDVIKLNLLDREFCVSTRAKLQILDPNKLVQEIWVPQGKDF